MSIYDDVDADVLQNYQEYNLANIIYYSLKESTTSEQSARMTAMDNASKNACKCFAWTCWTVRCGAHSMSSDESITQRNVKNVNEVPALQGGARTWYKAIT